jgi:quinol monooxygenase YgiN
MHLYPHPSVQYVYLPVRQHQGIKHKVLLIERYRNRMAVDFQLDQDASQWCMVYLDQTLHVRLS